MIRKNAWVSIRQTSYRKYPNVAFNRVSVLADRDECQEWGYCDQLCANTEGSYTCSCYPGFDLVDNKNCIASKVLIPYSVYFAHDKSIWKIESVNQSQEVVANGSLVSGLDYHYSKNFLFWIDVKTKKVSD